MGKKTGKHRNRKALVHAIYYEDAGNQKGQGHGSTPKRQALRGLAEAAKSCIWLLAHLILFALAGLIATALLDEGILRALPGMLPL